MSAEAVPPRLTAAHTATVYNLLQSSLNAHDDVRKPVEELLATCERTPGFSKVLIGIIQQPNADLNVRLMAVICLKNVVNKYWKPRGRSQQGNIVSPEEKSALRQFVLTYMEESNRQVKTQLAVLTSKIARTDWPKEWPDLFNSLVSNLQPSVPISRLHNAILTLNRVLKELSTKRLMVDKKFYQEMAAALQPVVLSIWVGQAQSLFGELSALFQSTDTQSRGARLQQMVLPFELLILLSKVQYRLLLNGLPKLNEHPEVATFLGQALEKMDLLLQLRENLEGPEGSGVILGHVEKLIGVLARTVMEAQREYALAFRPFLSPFLEFFYSQLFASFQSRKPPLSRLLTNAVTFLSNTAACKAYRDVSLAKSSRLITARGDVQVTAEAVTEAKDSVTAFFTTDRVLNLFHLVVMKLLLLTDDDIESWAADPEGFVVAQESLTPEEHVRTAAENLLLSLLQEHKSFLGPALVSLVQQQTVNTSNISSATTADILRTDAIFLAAGLAAYDLHGQIEFVPWFLGSLVPLLQANPQTGMPPILRRRILWLIGCWMADVTEEIRTPLYQSIIQLLNESNSTSDNAVTVTAVGTLKSLIEDWNFEKDIFKPYIQSSVEALYSVMARAEQTETRLQIMNVLSLLVERCGNDILPSVNAIVSPIPAVWEASAEQNLIRGAILQVLSHVVTATGSNSTSLFPILLPLLGYCTDINQPEEVYLMEGGLELWQETMKNAAHYTAELHALFSNVEAFMARDFDYLKQAMTLIESYILLGKADFLNTHAASVSRIFERLVGQLKPRGAALVTKAIELLLKAFPVEAVPMLRGILSTMVTSCMATLDKEDESNERDPDTVIVGYLAVLARVLYHQQGHLLAILGEKYPGREKAQLVRLLELMLDKFDNVGYSTTGPYRRKMIALALVSIMGSGDPDILTLGNQIVDACVDVLHEFEANNGESVAEVYLPQSVEGIPEVSEDLRRRALLTSDVAYAVDLKAAVRKTLDSLSHSLGTQGYDKLIGTFEPSNYRYIMS